MGTRGRLSWDAEVTFGPINGIGGQGLVMEKGEMHRGQPNEEGDEGTQSYQEYDRNVGDQSGDLRANFGRVLGQS